jgi:hypothetical protein
MDDLPRLTKITGPLLVLGGPYSNREATKAILAEAPPQWKPDCGRVAIFFLSGSYEHAANRSNLVAYFCLRL